MKFLGLYISESLDTICATRWRGDVEIGSYGDSMEIFFGTVIGSGHDSDKDLRFNWGAYHVDKYNNSQQLFGAFIDWFNNHRDNTITITNSHGVHAMQGYTNYGHLVDITSIPAMADVSSYIARRRIQLAPAMLQEGSEPVKSATEFAMAYRHLIYALGLQDNAAADLAKWDGTALTLGIAI